MGGSLSYPLDYPTKPIPVGVFKYAVNVPHGTAEFLYEFEKLQLSKPPKTKLLRPLDNTLWKPSNNKLLKSFDLILDQGYSDKLLRPFAQEGIENNKPTKSLETFIKGSWDNPEKSLDEDLPQMWESELKSMSIPNMDITLDTPKNLSDDTTLNITLDSNKSLGLNFKYFELDKEQLKFLNDEKDINITKDLDISLSNLEIIGVNKLKADYQLNRTMDSFKISIVTDLMVNVESDREITCDKAIALKCNNLRELNTHYNNYVTIEDLRQLNYTNLTFVSRIIDILAWSQSSGIFLDNHVLENLSKPNKTNLLRNVNLFQSYKIDKRYRLFRHNDYPMFMNTHTRMMYRYRLDSIFEQCMKYINWANGKVIYNVSNKPLERNCVYPIYQGNQKYIIKDSLDRIYWSQSKYHNEEQITPIIYLKDKALQGLEVQNIFLPGHSKYIGQSLDISIVKGSKAKGIKIDKRFWVVPPKLGEDSKIIPPDYDYSQYPLLGSPGLGYLQLKLPDPKDYTDMNKYQQDYDSIVNNGIKKLEAPFWGKSEVPYAYKPVLYDHHPNSQKFNPYIEHDDSSRGMYEMPLAINIMIEMVNLVGLIVHHSASQFCYCSGQEAMWFIMELIDDWLNMESTQNALILTNSKDHYYRAYRWIRWEAEKVYFNCDITPGRFMGIKYAAELLGNLVQYMNQHHYNPSILWPDLSKMDYWRAQTNKPNHNPENDFIQLPDKIKGSRHYNLDTQKIDRRIYESMPE